MIEALEEINAGFDNAAVIASFAIGFSRIESGKKLRCVLEITQYAIDVENWVRKSMYLVGCLDGCLEGWPVGLVGRLVCCCVDLKKDSAMAVK